MEIRPLAIQELSNDQQYSKFVIPPSRPAPNPLQKRSGRCLTGFLDRGRDLPCHGFLEPCERVRAQHHLPRRFVSASERSLDPCFNGSFPLPQIPCTAGIRSLSIVSPTSRSFRSHGAGWKSVNPTISDITALTHKQARKSSNLAFAVSGRHTRRRRVDRLRSAQPQRRLRQFVSVSHPIVARVAKHPRLLPSCQASPPALSSPL